ncbi:MAG: Zn-dependent protease [uncultured bacterium (gcode 4)]|uniref:Zn-dependent protease n=1 Tax=uncultured bacterium (gcode 4) TaxID=1234023 RepID=K2GD83_9BACT|nr:MAG: Zn-dependent protease [uncultured bacterium (gcode 4)]
MKILKRIFLFLMTNIAILFLIWIIIFILDSYFWIKISPNLRSWMVPLLIFSAIYGFSWAFISLAISRWIAKRAYSIELIEESKIRNYPPKVQHLFFKTREFANQKWINMPEFGIYESAEVNAFATWPSKNKSLVAFSAWAIENMDQNELEWVLAHEMSHVINGDMVTMTLVQWVINTFVIFLARVIAYFIDMAISKDEERSWIAYHATVIILDMVLSVFALIVVMAYSRRREFTADKDSGIFTPKQNMIKALRRLKQLSSVREPIQDEQLAAFKISWKKSFAMLFSSHPDLDDRINKLENSF